MPHIPFSTISFVCSTFCSLLPPGSHPLGAYSNKFRKQSCIYIYIYIYTLTFMITNYINIFYSNVLLKYDVKYFDCRKFVLIYKILTKIYNQELRKHHIFQTISYWLLSLRAARRGRHHTPPSARVLSNKQRNSPFT
jgi:hypothetical protein